jgi:hypothetical protein
VTPPPKTLAGVIAQGFRALGANELMVATVTAEAGTMDWPKPSLAPWYERSEHPDLVVWLAAALVLGGPACPELSQGLALALLAVAETELDHLTPSLLSPALEVLERVELLVRGHTIVERVADARDALARALSPSDPPAAALAVREVDAIARFVEAVARGNQSDARASVVVFGDDCAALSGRGTLPSFAAHVFAAALPWTSLAVRWRAAVCPAFCASCGRASEHLAQVPARSLAEQLCAACAPSQEGPR